MGDVKKNLYQRIQSVSNDIKNIEKNMRVGTGNYAYNAVSDLDVTLEVKKSETNHGLISIPIKQELVNSEIIKTLKKDGSESINYVDIVKMTIRIVNLDNTSEYIDIESFGRGLDSGDKGFGKASTYARKYGLLNAYKIATGEDPDQNKSEEQRAAPTPDEIRIRVTNYMLSDSNYTNALLSHFNLGSIDEMSAEQFKMADVNLRKKGLVAC